MQNIIQQLLTGKDNKTYDIARVSWCIGLLAVLILAGYEAFEKGISLREFAEAFGLISGAHGAAVMIKGNTEPDPDYPRAPKNEE